MYMQQWPRRGERITGMIIPVVWLLCLAVPVYGGTLGEDSSRFAAYWDLMETGDSAAAQNLLMNLGDNEQLGQMANFFLAWKAYVGGDFANVPVYLGLGTPADLADHAAWLKADALARTGQSSAAESLWTQLSTDTASVYHAEAIYRLANAERDAGNLDLFLELAVRYDSLAVPADKRQSLRLRVGETLAELARHEEAVTRLWNAVVLGPATEEAGAIREFLRGYADRYGYRPREETIEETAAEFAVLERNNRYSLGLKRAQDELSRSTDPGKLDLATYYKGRFLCGLGQYKDAVETLLAHRRFYPQSPNRFLVLLYLGRSAYLKDQDSLAIGSLTQAADSSKDPAVVGKALDLLGVLYLDRGRAVEAVKVYRRWEEMSRGTDMEEDCLWKLGITLWQADSVVAAGNAWRRLYDAHPSNDYAPGALYWWSRAARRAGDVATAKERSEELYRRYPYAYYGVISGVNPDSVRPDSLPLVVPGLDELCGVGGAHCRKFAELVAMRITDLAQKEWSKAASEQPDSDGFEWWKARLLLWNNDRMAAYRVLRTELWDYIRAAGERPRGFNSILYPLDFDPEIVRLARQSNLDPYFVFGLICQESHYEPAIASSAGAVGLMQLMPPTAKRMARQLGIPYSAAKLRDPDYNLRLGVHYLANLFMDFNGDSVLMLAAYNAGESAAQSWYEEFGDHDEPLFVERIPFRETRLFVKRNTEHRAAYHRLYPDVTTMTPDSTAPTGKK
jgi:soluble lytic murein transglycosylase-like protein/TolA-binding protein